MRLYPTNTEVIFPSFLRSKNSRLNLVVFRLAACCGVRASEIAHLQLADVKVEMPRPHLRIRASAAKGGRPRTVPL
jgi:integrase